MGILAGQSWFHEHAHAPIGQTQSHRLTVGSWRTCALGLGVVVQCDKFTISILSRVQTPNLIDNVVHGYSVKAIIVGATFNGGQFVGRVCAQCSLHSLMRMMMGVGIGSGRCNCGSGGGSGVAEVGVAASYLGNLQ